MYLIISEESLVFTVDKITDEDKIICDQGALDIIDISSVPPKQYFNGRWAEVQHVQ